MDDESVDLIYLDPPFNSNRAYNIIYEDDIQAQAFDDTWIWTPECDRILTEDGPGMDMLRAMVGGMGKIHMAAYLVMMTPRLAHLHRVLKPTGSIYLHCDPTASHYLKVIMDSIFETKNFRNEIVWQRQRGAKSDAKQYGRNTDRLLFYGTSEKYTFVPPRQEKHNPKTIKDWYKKSDKYGKYVSRPLTAAGTTSRGDSGKSWRGIRPTGHWTVPEILQKRYEDRFKKKLTGTVRERLDVLADAKMIDFSSNGKPSWRRYLHEATLPRIHDIWNDDNVRPISRKSKEKLGYPTQKPIALLERILRASSNPGDIILDPFCGCGTTVHAAENLNRNWIGIDITYSAIAAIQERFKRARQDIWNEISIENRPTTMQQVEDRFLNGKQSLSARKEFEKFCVTTIGGLPNETMGADGGIDGRIRLQESKRALVSVKSGRVDVRPVRELKGLLGEKDIAGVFITKQKPTTPMIEFANQAGICKMKGDGLFSIDPFPKMQILTLEQILNGKTPNIPYAA